MKLRMREKKYLLSGRHHFFTSRMLILTAILFFAVLAGILFSIRRSHSAIPPTSALYSAWKSGDYQTVYDKSAIILSARPLDGVVLSLHGFSAYYLYSAQTDPSVAQNYLGSTITSLRNAWYRVSDSEKPRLAYILGKAYYQRGYYYADLSAHYLGYAHDAGLKFADLDEFRGLAASQLADYETAISAFTEALSSNPSDLLLFTLAQNYQKAGDTAKSKQYILETMRTTGDELLQLKCHYELGSVLLAEQNYDGARAEFDAILEKDPNSADAHYGLGVIYETQGDLIRARAEWRRAIKINPVHSGARSKLEI